MFENEFIARGLDEDSVCQVPIGDGKRCERHARWSVPIGFSFLPCCQQHMDQALDLHRANKQQQQMFQRAMQQQQTYTQDISTANLEPRKHRDTEELPKNFPPRLRKKDS